MSQDPQPNNPDEESPKGNRSVMLILIFLGILIVLAVVGGDSAPKEMTRDALLGHLYTGEVSMINASAEGGTYEVELVKGIGEDNQKYRVAVPDVRVDIVELTRLLAQGAEIGSISQSDFVNQVNTGSIVPLRGYPLRITQLINPQQTKGGVEIKQRFFAEYLTHSEYLYAEIESNSSDNSTFDMIEIYRAFEAAGKTIDDGIVLNVPNGLTTKTASGWTTFFYSFGPILLFMLLFYFLFMRQRGGQGGMMGFPKSRATLYNKEHRTGVTFADVAGVDEAKEEVSEITEFLRNPGKFTSLGGRLPRGVLLVGPPGTGKTLLAKAIAGEADVPFISISGSDFVEMFVGVGASRVRDLFEQARKESPCIIFLDEIDAVGRKRGQGTGGGNDEREQTLNAILVEMDGFSSDERIIVIAATNRADVLDRALLRPGRFDRQVTVDLPDVKGREAILKVHAGLVKMHPDTCLKSLAKGTPGFSGAELAALLNEAAIIAAMAGHLHVSQDDLEESRDKVRFGRQKKSHAMDEKDLRETAIHEAGHAVVSYFMEHSDPVHKITIIPRGNALGATFFLPEKDHYNWSKKQLLDEICVLFGGYAAEQPFLNDTSAGVSNDLERATKLAHTMVRRFGMSSLGPINLDLQQNEWGMGERMYSEKTAQLIDEEVAQIVSDQQLRADDIIRDRHDLIQTVTEALIKYETINSEEFTALMKGTSVEDLREETKTVVEMPSVPPPVPAADAANEAIAEDNRPQAE
ncbi:MAG: ATP-dependent zinc metalloprotease FtsH [Planctomycetota bacterium]|nr:ATP-dependent zinc metalloprotease FtsH [Planctomycetota bacterium]